jgi:polyhydroxyalkanoate depolymerase
LRRFAQAGTRRTVLLCAPLAGHAAVMMRETVEALLADGDVCVTDWVNARDVPLAAGRFGLDEYVATLDGFVDALASDARPLHVVAVCQATVPALGALALRAAQPAAAREHHADRRPNRRASIPARSARRPRRIRSRGAAVI